MTIRRHKGNTKQFAELTFQEQANSITALINNLQNSILHHIGHSARPVQTRAKCLNQIKRLLVRLGKK